MPQGESLFATVVNLNALKNQILVFRSDEAENKPCQQTG